MKLSLLVLFCLAPALAQAQPIALSVEGYGDAAVVVPTGAGARPVVIALHGNFDRPEWMCAAWSAFVDGRAFILWLVSGDARFRAE